MKKLLLVFLLALAVVCASAGAEQALPAAGDVVEGFTVQSVDRFEMIGADLVRFIHDKTGAELLYIANSDTNRVFEITFRTPALTDNGMSHIFEHSTLDGSEKYPSASLFFNLAYQTYNTYLNAATYNFMTTFPMASLSEAQLLAYADYYLDSCLHPVLKNNEAIFREEAWRYSLESAEDDLTIAGTVYSEMQGANTLEVMAYTNYLKHIIPGSTKANVSGGLVSEIPDLTFQALCDYHETYYHPSNSFSCLYGSFEDYTAFLKLANDYFSAYEKKDFVIEDSAYAPISEPVTADCPYPMEAGASEENGSVIYYGFVCDTKDETDLQKLDLLTTMLMEGSSDMAQAMKERFPSGSFGCYYDNSTPETLVTFYLRGVNSTDAEAFRDTVNEMLAKTAQDGFTPESVDAMQANTRLSTLLISEESDLGVNIIPNFAFYWALTGDYSGYIRSLDALDHFVDYNSDGTYAEVIGRLLLNNARTALVSTRPVAGLKDIEDAELAAHLAEVKAAMTPEEIDAIVAQTAALAAPAEDDASAYVAQLQAVTVQSLPEEARIYDINDVTESGVRYITADANVDGVGRAMLMLDASGLTTEQLLTFKLYTDLLGDLDTPAHTRAQLSSLVTRYLYDGVVKVSLTGKDQELHPYLRMSFTALDEDLQAGYDTLYELLFDSDLTDVARLTDTVSSLVSSLKREMNSNFYLVNVYRAMSKGSAASAAYNYITYLDYYDYLRAVQERLEREPEAVVAELAAIQQYFRNSYGAVVCYAGNEESAQKHRAIADQFLARLDSAPVEPQTYVFPQPSAAEAIIIDSSVQYNLVFATYEELGLEEYEGAMDAVTTLVTDAYLMPLLRDQYGVYSVIHNALEDGVVIETYRDPNIAQTYAIYEALPELIAASEVTQEDLDNYILAAYSGYALGKGELAGAESALLTILNGDDQNEKIEIMQSLKSVTPEHLKAYAALYAALMEKGTRITAGGASAIAGYGEHYDAILDPFGAADAQLPADLEDGSIYADAALFCRENGLMEDLSADAFGVYEPATVGELASVMYLLVGMDGTTEDALAFWTAYGVLAGQVDDPLTREALASGGFNLLLAVGIEVSEAMPEGYEDLAEADESAVGALGFAIENGLMTPGEGGLLAPKAVATRGEVALYMRGIME